MEQEIGLCIIDEKGRKGMTTIGTAGIAASIVMWSIFFLVGMPSFLQFMVFLASWVGYMGLWQSGFSFCEEHARFHKGASRNLHKQSFLFALGITTFIFAFAILITPVPGTVIKETFMRVLEGL